MGNNASLQANAAFIQQQQLVALAVTALVVVVAAAAAAVSTATASARTEGRASPRRIRYVAPESLTSGLGEGHVREVVSSTNTDGGNSSSGHGDCAVCLAPMVPGLGQEEDSGLLVRVYVCGHVFHKECFGRVLQHSRSCPVCRKVIQEPRGKMPSGTMDVYIESNESCRGHGAAGTIVILYSLWSGIQKQYHDNPGQAYSSTTRVAYLPDNSDGRKLLKRLVYAFSRGLTFTVGVSMTTGKSNVITWASIHHKTNPAGGPYGYPDPSYFVNVNEELDNLGVPAADDLVGS